MAIDVSSLSEKQLKDLIRKARGRMKNIDKEKVGKVKAKVPPLRSLTKKPKRFAPGHGACPGCGVLPALELFFKGIEGDIVALFQTGCAYVSNRAAPSVTFQGPAGNTRTIKVLHPERLEGVNVGDTVELTFTEALALKVVEASAK